MRGGLAWSGQGAAREPQRLISQLLQAENADARRALVGGRGRGQAWLARLSRTRPEMLRCVLASCAVLLLLGSCASAPPPPTWVSSWEAAPQLVEVANNPPTPLADTTVRQVVHATGGGGARLRVQFSNVFGSGPVEIRAAHVAASASAPGAPVDSRILPATDTALSFAGAPGARIAPGAALWSDDVAFDLAPLACLAVTTAFGAAPLGVSGHPGSRTTSYQAPGANVSAPDMLTAATAPHWYIIAGLEVWGARVARAAVMLGDSITDGRGSTTDGNDRWPDVLAARLGAAGSNVSVVNAGIGGNALTGGGIGPTALARFARDVLSQGGAAFAVLFEGVNDIGAGVGAPAITAALDALRDNATAAGLAVIGATITPFGGTGYYSAQHEATRQAVNAHIRGAADVIDFDAVLSDGGMPPRLKAEYDSGDGLHPNAAGYAAMAGAIDLGLFA